MKRAPAQGGQLEYDVRGDGEPVPLIHGGVPYEKWHSDKAPEFFGVPFTRNDAFGVWMFHIWLYQRNPARIFANFNPRVPQC